LNEVGHDFTPRSWEAAVSFPAGILLRRLAQEVRPIGVREVVRLLWGRQIEVITSDVVGMGVAHQGLSDTVTTEILWRLTNPGDRTIDA
jgi:hypothetical protein